MQPTGPQFLNCTNCGAPFSLGAAECQYCHTPYAYPAPDLSHLDPDFDKPSLSFHFDHGKIEMRMSTGSLLSTMRCPSCGNTVPVSKSCPKCGSALLQSVQCRSCGKISKLGSRCSHCGKLLGVITSKDLDPNDLRDLGNLLSGAISPSIAATSTPASFVEQIKALALRQLAESGNYAPFDMRQQHDGTLEFIVNGASYGSVDEIPDANVKRAIQEAVDEWQKQE